MKNEIKHFALFILHLNFERGSVTITSRDGKIIQEISSFESFGSFLDKNSDGFNQAEMECFLRLVFKATNQL